MEFTKMEERLNTLRSLIAVITPVLAIWCLFTLNLIYKQNQLNRMPADAKIEVTLKKEVQTNRNRI